MASNNSTENPPAATDTSNIARRQHRGRRLAATLVTCALLGSTAIAITASGASAMPNDRCQSLTAAYEDQIMYVGDAFAAYTTDVLESQWADAAVAYKSYRAAYAESQVDFKVMQAACA